jgi:hypothetical protein
MRRAAWTWLWVAVAALAGCTDLAGGGYDYGTLAVRVTVGDSTPVANAVVELYNFQRTLAFGITDTDGRHEFRFVPRGDVGVRTLAEAPPGHVQTVADGISVPQGERVDVSVAFIRPCCGRVRARIVDELGQPVAGAGLILYAMTVSAREAQSGANGEFLFTELFAENYGLEVTPPAGYALRAGDDDFVDGILVRPSSDTTVVFPLRRIAATP